MLAGRPAHQICVRNVELDAGAAASAGKLGGGRRVV